MATRRDKSFNKETILHALSFRTYYEKELSSIKWNDDEQGMALCIWHDDHTPSLSVDAKTGHFRCFGCGKKGSIFDFHMLKRGLSFTEAKRELAELAGLSEAPCKTIVKEYDYTDTAGIMLFQVVRYQPKDFRQRRPDGNGDWIWNLEGITTVLYNLIEVVKAETVFIVEGEKDVETLRITGIVATTNPMGTGKWKTHYNQYLTGKNIVVLPDNDEPGRKHAEDIASSLSGIVKTIKIINLPDLPAKGDVTDWIMSGHAVKDLRDIVDTSRGWEPTKKKEAESNKLDPNDDGIFVSVGDLLDVEEPNRPDFWEKEIPQGSLVGISGLWGSMKSLLMQACAIRAAQGKLFLGRRLTQTETFYFDSENPRGVWKRRMLDLAGEDRPEKLHIMTLFGPIPPPAFNPDGIDFYNRLAEFHPGSLFIFDSLVRFYATGKQTENTEDAIHAMSVLKGLTRWGTTVIFMHHPPKNGGVFRGGGDLQAAPDLLFTLTHDKKRKRLTLQCTKNRFEEEHTLEIGYEATPDGGLVFVDIATVEETKQRAEDRKLIAAVLKIIKELFPKNESSKTRLLKEANERLKLSRRKAEPIIDNGVGVAWACTKLNERKYLYGPLCSDGLSTQNDRNAETHCNNGELECAQDKKRTAVHTELNPNATVSSVYTPYEGVHTGTHGRDSKNIDEDFPHEEDDDPAKMEDPDC